MAVSASHRNTWPAPAAQPDQREGRGHDAEGDPCPNDPGGMIASNWLRVYEPRATSEGPSSPTPAAPRGCADRRWPAPRGCRGSAPSPRRRTRRGAAQALAGHAAKSSGNAASTVTRARRVSERSLNGRQETQRYLRVEEALSPVVAGRGSMPPRGGSPGRGRTSRRPSAARRGRRARAGRRRRR